MRISGHPSALRLLGSVTLAALLANTGCDENGGGHVSNAGSGGSNSGDGGSNAGNGDTASGTGGSSSLAGLPECVTPADAVSLSVCVVGSDQLMAETSFSGMTRVTEVTSASDLEVTDRCRYAGDDGTTLVQLESTDGEQRWDLVLRMPGFSAEHIQVGDLIDFSLQAAWTRGLQGERAQTVLLARDNEPLLFASESTALRLPIPEFGTDQIGLTDEGATCFVAGPIDCRWRRHRGEMRIGDTSAPITPGESIDLGDWKVTMDRFDEAVIGAFCDSVSTTEIAGVRVP
jgi:hypothetical protein